MGEDAAEERGLARRLIEAMEGRLVADVVASARIRDARDPAVWAVCTTPVRIQLLGNWHIGLAMLP